MKKILILFIAFLGMFYFTNARSKLCLTFDDPVLIDTPLLNSIEKNDRILSALKKYKIQSAIFVCGKRIDNFKGMDLLKSWDDDNHLICNHSYSHNYYHSQKINAETFFQDIIKNDSIINNFKNYTKLFRFPYLKEGNTQEKRDSIRKLLKQINYKIGSVAIDASDWFIDEQMSKALKDNPNIDLEPFKQYYLFHILDRANYYNNLSVEINKREAPLTLLLHHNLLNSLFLEDLINLFLDKGWEIINASDAYKDELYSQEPEVLPAGESIIWSLAKHSGKFENELRYPGEDAEYEEELFDNVTRNYELNSKITLVELSEGFYLHKTYKILSGNPYPSNGLLVETSNGIILIDTPWNDFQTQKLIDTCLKKFEKKIILAIITHAHEDRIGGINALLNNRIKAISTKMTADFADSNGFKKPLPILPVDTTFIIDKIKVNTFYPGAGHTKDNIVVYFPDTRLLFGGCLIKSIDSKNLGYTTDAVIDEWDNTVEKLLKKYPDINTVIPGHGSVGGKELLEHTIKLVEEYKDKHK